MIYYSKKSKEGSVFMSLSEKKRASNAKWDSANLKRLSLALPVADYERMQEHIKQTSETQNGFIKRAIKETMSNDYRKQGTDD